ncbi:hypothetical protein SCAR479_03725 [Seiridium cardinale]|uniref:Uncharacterized protein n=1 Tax=Seiridium cardinale TaxID=138064 RepID=A0ABR2XZK8_9PEZI
MSTYSSSHEPRPKVTSVEIDEESERGTPHALPRSYADGELSDPSGLHSTDEDGVKQSKSHRSSAPSPSSNSLPSSGRVENHHHREEPLSERGNNQGYQSDRVGATSTSALDRMLADLEVQRARLIRLERVVNERYWCLAERLRQVESHSRVLEYHSRELEWRLYRPTNERGLFYSGYGHGHPYHYNQSMTRPVFTPRFYH